MSIIQATNLTKKFKDYTAVNNLTFNIEKGTILGFLGPNGAGKTTTVRLLNGLLTPTSGQAHIIGLDVAKDGEKVRQRTGVQTDTNIYESLTAVENLSIWGNFYNMQQDKLTKKIDELLEMFGLETKKNNKVGTFSKGMKQKLLVARALLHDPEVVFLDEPTSGLDPEAAEEVIRYLKAYMQIGDHTVFYCSHRLEEVEMLCNMVAIINNGEIKAHGTIDELRKNIWPQQTYLISAENPDELENYLKKNIHASYTREQNTFTTELPNNTTISETIRTLVQCNIALTSVTPVHHTLKEIYFKIIPQQKI